MAEAELLVPAAVGDYTDFYASVHHASLVGSLFRPDNPLLPNYKYVPIGYHGRASSLVPSGAPVRRPRGQTKPPNADRPAWGPSRALDYECEVGAFVGPGNPLGTPIPIGEAESHLFGLCLVNDWSARDVQSWEYQPLGPFLSKSFATSVSPWVVTLDALEPFRVAGPVQEPEPLPYLRLPDSGGDRDRGAIDLHLEVALRPAGAGERTTICRTNFQHMYWSMAQQLAHHTVSGCNTRVGDLMASGTISGPTPDSFGSLLELTWNGRKPLAVGGGAERTFIEDGDEVVMSGWCKGDGYRVGFGEVTGGVLPALPAE
jgi:fumarylacetoacetase